MSPLLRSGPARVLLAPLLAACSGACATLLDPGPPVLRIRTDTVVATVRDARGRTLGTTPLRTRLPARRRQTLVLTAPGYDSAVVTLGSRVKDALPTLINPLSWPVDAATGAYWTHDPAALDVHLTPLASSSSTDAPDAPDAPGETGETGEVSDPVAALVLAAFADAAQAAGCEPMLVDAWRDAARLLAQADTAAVPDSVRREAAAEVLRASPEIRDLCARPSPRVEELRSIRETVARPPPPAPEVPDLSAAPVFFGPHEWDVLGDSTRARLRALGTRLADTPVVLLVEGFADGAELRHRELGYQRALSVIRALRAGGLSPDCCVVVSHSGDPAFLSASAAVPPRLNRRVTLTLSYRESP